MPSLDNAGVIQATATTTDTSITSLSAFAIIDNSGTLLNILNESTGVISAGVTNLKNNEQVSRAIDLESANDKITITNNGKINGDILLGAHSDTVTVAGISATAPASITGAIYFGGNDGINPTCLLSEANGTVASPILNDTGDYIAIHVESKGTSISLITARCRSLCDDSCWWRNAGWHRTGC